MLPPLSVIAPSTIVPGGVVVGLILRFWFVSLVKRRRSTVGLKSRPKDVPDGKVEIGPSEVAV